MSIELPANIRLAILYTANIHRATVAGQATDKAQSDFIDLSAYTEEMDSIRQYTVLCCTVQCTRAVQYCAVYVHGTVGM